MELGLESTENHMMTLGEQLLGWGRITAPEEVAQRLRAVRPSEVRRAMEDFLRPERLSLALVSPRKDGARLEALLGKIPR
jgi:predicted Zn-dependent peptidase